MTELETAPIARERATVRIRRSQRYGRKLSKLASDRHPAIVRSLAEQRDIEQKASEAYKAIRAMKHGRTQYASHKAEAYTREQLAADSAELFVPMFRIALVQDDVSLVFYASGSVVSDYAREGVPYIILEKPAKRQGLHRMRARNVIDGYLEALEGEDNDATIVARAYRAARAEGDQWAIEIVEHWQYHGALWQCPSPATDCPWCKSHRTIATEEMVAFAYEYGPSFLEPQGRKALRRTLPRHRMPAPSIEELVYAFSGNYRVQ